MSYSDISTNLKVN